MKCTNPTLSPMFQATQFNSSGTIPLPVEVVSDTTAYDAYQKQHPFFMGAGRVMGRIMGLKEKKVFVAGATGGLGQAHVRFLQAAGCQVTASGRNRNILTALAGPNTQLLLMDITEAETVKNAIAGLYPQHDLYQCINASGIFAGGQIAAERGQQIMSVNVDGAENLLCAAMAFLQTEGRFVSYSSIAEQLPDAAHFWPDYEKSKVGLRVMVEGLRNQAAQKGVKIVTAKPGTIKTELWDKSEGVKDWQRHFTQKFGTSAEFCALFVSLATQLGFIEISPTFEGWQIAVLGAAAVTKELDFLDRYGDSNDQSSRIWRFLFSAPKT